MLKSKTASRFSYHFVPHMAPKEEACARAHAHTTTLTAAIVTWSHMNVTWQHELGRHWDILKEGRSALHQWRTLTHIHCSVLYCNRCTASCKHLPHVASRCLSFFVIWMLYVLNLLLQLRWCLVMVHEVGVAVVTHSGRISFHAFQRAALCRWMYANQRERTTWSVYTITNWWVRTCAVNAKLEQYLIRRVTPIDFMVTAATAGWNFDLLFLA